MTVTIKRLLLVTLGTAFLVSCSDSSDLESRYDTSVASLVSFLDKHGEEGNNHVFRIVLVYLEATPIDALSDNRIVHAVYNPERAVLALQWVGAEPYIEGVRISDGSKLSRSWDVALDPSELKFQEQRSMERVDTGTTLYLSAAVAAEVNETLQAEDQKLSLSLLLKGQVISRKYSEVQLVCVQL